MKEDESGPALMKETESTEVTRSSDSLTRGNVTAGLQLDMVSTWYIISLLLPYIKRRQRTVKTSHLLFS
jgi:hypothetical protein